MLGQTIWCTCAWFWWQSVYKETIRGAADWSYDCSYRCEWHRWCHTFEGASGPQSNRQRAVQYTLQKTTAQKSVLLIKDHSI